MLPSGIPHAEDSREPRQPLIAQGPASSLRSPASNQTDPASHPRPDQHPQASPRRPRRARASPPLSARPSASPGLQSRVCPPPTRTHRPRPRRLATPARASQSCGCERRDTDRRKPGQRSARALARACTQTEVRTRNSASVLGWPQWSSAHPGGGRSRSPTLLGIIAQVSSSFQQLVGTELRASVTGTQRSPT